MPTGLGSRKVLTPRSTKAPRRSLPPQAKLIEAASFDSLDSQPSSPDIMTTKLMEKVKKNNSANNKSANKDSKDNSSFNQRLAAAAIVPNSLAANSGRSKLSTEEFKLDDEIVEQKYEKYDKYNNNQSISNNNNNNNNNNKNNNSYNTSSSYNSYKSTSNNTTKSYSGSHGMNQNSSNHNHNYTNNSNNSFNNNSFNSSSSHSNNYSLNNNSFDRWNSSMFNGESVELLQEQLSHLRREYEGLKQRFSELSRLRLSEPEEHLEEHKKLSESRDLAAERTIKALQKENEELKKQLQAERERGKEKETAVEKKSSVVESSLDVDESFMKEVEKILKIYSSFSGLKITPSPNSPLNQWHCEFSSRSGRFDFQLIYESDLNRYQYLPETLESDHQLSEGRIKNLPPFLASDILITADQMQMFFWRLLDTLSKKKD